MVSGLVCSTGSGNAAMATRLTAVAETAAVSAPAPRKKLRLENIVKTPDSVGRCTAARAGHRGRGSSAAEAGLADECHVEVRLGDPEIAQCLDRGVNAGDLGSGIGQQLEHADEHAVVEQHVFV